MALEAAVIAAISVLGVPEFEIWTFAYVGVIFGFGVIVALCLAVIHRDGSNSGTTILTDRRVLHQGSSSRAEELGRDRMVTIPLAHIAGLGLVDWGDTLSVRVERPAPSEAIDLQSPRPQALADALADLAGVPKPDPVGWLEHLAKDCMVFGGLTLCFLMIRLNTIFDNFGLDEGAHGSWFPLADLTLDLSAIPLGIWLGTHLAAIAAFLVMPRFASAEQFGNWLRLTPQRKWVRRLGWKSRPYRWLARRVYGSDLKTSAERSV